jgi:hypothetical protein
MIKCCGFLATFDQEKLAPKEFENQEYKTSWI